MKRKSEKQVKLREPKIPYLNQKQNQVESKFRGNKGPP